MADYSKIQEQIEAAKKAQIAAELEMMAAANARLEAARVENEKRRLAAEAAWEEAVARKQKQFKDAAEAAEQVKRAEEAQKRAEEHKINLAMEAKAREEAQAEELKKKILDLQFQHEQALKALRDSFDMASAAELVSYKSTEQVALDGTEPKPITENIDGSVNPLKQHLHAVNN